MGKKVIETKQAQEKAPVEKVIAKTKEQVLELRAQRITRIKQQLLKLITIDKAQLKKAAVAVIQMKEQTKNIFDIGDDFIYLEIIVNKVPISHSIKPIAIQLPHPIYSQEMNSKFCIISSNPQRKFKNLIQDLEIPLIQKVVGYGKLIKNYPTYTDKRKLFYEYDQFFCDESIYSGLAKATGKIFYERKKIPYPIKVDDTDPKAYEQYLNNLAKNTYFIQGNGPVYTLKIARSAQKPEQITENAYKAVYDILPHILREKGMSLACVRSISLKLAKSLSLPFHVRLSVRELEAWQKQ